MMKWLIYLGMAILSAGSWHFYSKSGKEFEESKRALTILRDAGDPNDDEQIKKMQTDLISKENDRIMNGILLTFLSAGLVGAFFVFTVLPFFAQSLSQGMIGSNEKVEKDVMHDARSLRAQGDYEGAIKAYLVAAATDPMNRMPWNEIVKIQKDQLADPAAAIETIRQALESQPWGIEDAAFFLFRLADLYEEVDGDRNNATAILQQVIEQFPETRHSANASHKLKEWNSPAPSTKMTSAAVSQNLADEEAEFLAKLRRAEAAEEADRPRRES